MSSNLFFSAPMKWNIENSDYLLGYVSKSIVCVCSCVAASASAIMISYVGKLTAAAKLSSVKRIGGDTEQQQLKHNINIENHI